MRASSHLSTGCPSTFTTCMPGASPISAASFQTDFSRIFLPLLHQNMPTPVGSGSSGHVTSLVFSVAVTVA